MRCLFARLPPPAAGAQRPAALRPRARAQAEVFDVLAVSARGVAGGRGAGTSTASRDSAASRSPAGAAQRRAVAAAGIREGASSATFGVSILQQVKRELRLKELVRKGQQNDKAVAAAVEAEATGASGAAAGGKAQVGADDAPRVEGAGGDPEEVTRKQLRNLFKEVPTSCGLVFCYLLHTTFSIPPKVSPALDAATFERIWTEEKNRHFRGRGREVLKRRRTRRKYQIFNQGYSEPEVQHEAADVEFTKEWRSHSIAEDIWKAEYYQHLHRTVHGRRVPEGHGAQIRESEPLAIRSDRLADIFAESFRKHVLDQNRPVLMHELADYENPYMMKRSALERLLQERCVRNKLDEKVMPRLLDRHPDLVKLRSEASLPPEVLEPLAAFRGDARWSFDSRERLAQKLEGARAALDALDADATTAEVVAALPENVPTDPEQVGFGVNHPWRNHLGFESVVPQGVAGGTRFGKPATTLEEQVAKMRYPTLQRVAHTLPADPKYRAHVVRTIRVLERSKDWDFKSKLKAVNQMKEIYDSMRPSEEYTAKLDKYLPLNRVPSHLKRKYARDKQYVKTFRKHFMLKKSYTRYRPSLTATAQMKIASSKLSFNVGGQGRGGG